MLGLRRRLEGGVVFVVVGPLLAATVPFAPIVGEAEEERAIPACIACVLSTVSDDEEAPRETEGIGAGTLVPGGSNVVADGREGGKSGVAAGRGAVAVPAAVGGGRCVLMGVLLSSGFPDSD